MNGQIRLLITVNAQWMDTDCALDRMFPNTTHHPVRVYKQGLNHAHLYTQQFVWVHKSWIWFGCG